MFWIIMNCNSINIELYTDTNQNTLFTAKITYQGGDKCIIMIHKDNCKYLPDWLQDKIGTF